MDSNRDEAVATRERPQRNDIFEHPLKYWWGKNRRNVAVAAAVLSVTYLALEVFNQFRIQQAAGYLADGKHAEALKTIDGWRFGILRSGTATRIHDESTYHLSMVEHDDAVSGRNWYVAHKQLAIAVESGTEADADGNGVRDALDRWSGELGRMHSAGDFAKCRNALDLLNRVEFRTVGSQDKASNLSHDLTMKLVRGFAEHQAWTEALKEIDILREHPKATDEHVTSVTREVHDRMVSTMNKALQSNEYDRAEAIARMLESYFPDQSMRKSFLTDLKYSKLIAEGDAAQKKDRFDKAMEAYDRALKLSPGNRDAFARIKSLRNTLRLYTKESGHWCKTAPGGDRRSSEISEAWRVCKDRPSRRRLYYRSSRPAGYKDLRLYSEAGLKGSWSLRLDQSSGSPQWIVDIQVSAPLNRRRDARAFGGIKIGLVVLNESEKAVFGKVFDIPLMLKGDSRRFQKRILSNPGEYWIYVGLEP